MPRIGRLLLVVPFLSHPLVVGHHAKNNEPTPGLDPGQKSPSTPNKVILMYALRDRPVVSPVMKPRKRQQQIDRQMAAIREKILAYGWMVVGVYADSPGDGSAFAYTIGLTDAGLPELLITGNLDYALMQTLLNDAAHLHVETELKPGDEVSEIANVVFKVALCGPEAPIQQAHNYYYHRPERTHSRVRVLQLIWPDENGLYPGPFSRFDATTQPLY